MDYYDQPDAEAQYEDPGDNLDHHIYFQGVWRNGPESLTHARETEDREDCIAPMFYARTVNVVMGPGNGTVGEADTYCVVKLPEFEGHLLKLSSKSSDFAVFEYAFGSYDDRPTSYPALARAASASSQRAEHRVWLPPTPNALLASRRPWSRVRVSGPRAAELLGRESSRRTSPPSTSPRGAFRSKLRRLKTTVVLYGMSRRE